jgi:ABC-type glycerol-3-phosphate transport system substrate-binding protein
MSIIACLLTAFTLAAGSAAAYAQSDLSSLVNNAKQEKEVVWYTTTSAGDNQAIVAGFTKKYPFLKVQVLRSTGEKLRQRVLTETSAGQYFSDVLSVSSMEMGLLKSRNLLQPYDPPEAEGYPANAKDKEKSFTAIYARNFVMGYNTAMIPEKDVRGTGQSCSIRNGKASSGSTKKSSNGTARSSTIGAEKKPLNT